MYLRLTLVLSLVVTLLVPSAGSAQDNEIVSAIKDAGGNIRNVSGGLEISFHLGTSEVTDQHLALVAKLDNVVVLNLKRTKISNRGLSYVSDMDSLRKLHLELTDVDDQDLSYLIDLKRLTYLNIFGTKITDAGIPHLVQMKHLTHLYVWKTNITSDGLRKLHDALPSVKIVAGIDLTKIVLPDPDAPTEPPMSKLRFIRISNITSVPKSGNGENIEVVFENRTKQRVKVVWVGYDGKLKVYGELEPGATRVQNSYENNTWLITSIDDVAIGYFICGDERALAVIP